MRAATPFPTERCTFPHPAAFPHFSTHHVPKSGQRARTKPLCSPSASVPIPSTTIPRTSDPSHDPPSHLPHVPRPKEAAGSRRSPASCEVSVVLGDRDCAHRRATRALVSCASSAAILPPRLSQSSGPRRRRAPRKCSPGSLSEKWIALDWIVDSWIACTYALCATGVLLLYKSTLYTHRERGSSHILDRVRPNLTQCSQVRDGKSKLTLSDGNQNPRADDPCRCLWVEYRYRKMARKGMEPIGGRWQI